MAWSILPSCFELSLWIDCPPITNSVANSDRNSFLEQWVLEFRFGLFRSSLLLFSQSYRVRCQCFHDGVVDFQFRGAMPNNCLVWLGVFYHRVLSCHCGLIVRRLQIRWPIQIGILSSSNGFWNSVLVFFEVAFCYFPKVTEFDANAFTMEWLISNSEVPCPTIVWYGLEYFTIVF